MKIKLPGRAVLQQRERVKLTFQWKFTTLFCIPSNFLRKFTTLFFVYYARFMEMFYSVFRVFFCRVPYESVSTAIVLKCVPEFTNILCRWLIFNSNSCILWYSQSHTKECRYDKLVTTNPQSQYQARNRKNLKKMCAYLTNFRFKHL